MRCQVRLFNALYTSRMLGHRQRHPAGKPDGYGLEARAPLRFRTGKRVQHQTGWGARASSPSRKASSLVPVAERHSRETHIYRSVRRMPLLTNGKDGPPIFPGKDSHATWVPATGKDHVNKFRPRIRDLPAARRPITMLKDPTFQSPYMAARAPRRRGGR
jgi:hypothetical protein